MAQGSVYRKIELLLVWVMPVLDRLPKSLSCQELGRKALADLTDSLDLATFALKAERGTLRLQYIDALIVRMTDLKTIVRIFRTMSIQREPRVLTQDQYTTFIELLRPISAEVGRWRASNAGTASSRGSDHRE
ncbi:MAG: hypothetical protein IJ271_05535 [Bacteroidales bacterium]|nr:hypothetical protein [Bacteroidales bacterium]MBQ8049098.1 hypothetical protein [Bacteroidales bacterium]